MAAAAALCIIGSILTRKISGHSRATNYTLGQLGYLSTVEL